MKAWGVSSVRPSSGSCPMRGLRAHGSPRTPRKGRVVSTTLWWSSWNQRPLRHSHLNKKAASPTMSRTTSRRLLRPRITFPPRRMLHLAVSDSRLNLPKQVGGRP